MINKKYKEYLICKERGHTSQWGTTQGKIIKRKCDFCGTTYWSETVKFEENVPEKPKEDNFE